MDAKLQTSTEERMNVLKGAIAASVRRTPLSVNGVMEKLSGARIDLDYNRAIVERLVRELCEEGRAIGRNGSVAWNHARGLCHENDGKGVCRCCGDLFMRGKGGRLICPSCLFK
ncbi:MAG: hypothetical protein V1696_03220 [Candidatus Jorgensenbacteria bacterium]